MVVHGGTGRRRRPRRGRTLRHVLLSRVELRESAPLHIVFLSLHGVSAGIALLIGPLQFVRRTRAERPQVHRTTGKVYLLAVLIAGVMSLASAVVSESGWSAQVGFVLLALFWFYTGFQALRAVLAGRSADHRIWMIRNYSGTFAAVVLRVILIVETSMLPQLGVDLEFAAAYDVAVLPATLSGSVPADAAPLGSRATPQAR